MTFDAHKLVHSEPFFWTICTKFDNCCQRYNVVHNFFYIGAVEFSSSLSAIYTKWCAQTYPPIFGLFAIFDLNFAKIVAPPGNKNENYIMHLKEKSIVKKSAANRIKIGP